MIILHYSADTVQIETWKGRLNNIQQPYILVEGKEYLVPYVLEGEKKVEGVSAIDSYLEEQKQFEDKWYEERCDKYEFDPDAPTPLTNPNLLS